ncbi:hypothetical protein [Cellulomonas fimi]|uniref:Uncharacterized protein n=1 Tax=Cellulomonas fimi TaxID=1708 RepID=A0A7Y0M1D2_CELFI|nr:hypothetical protein [Cellulomonas fimi]NMR21649.1 hypothetical protein [Cellulomonas fimi]
MVSNENIERPVDADREAREVAGLETDAEKIQADGIDQPSRAAGTDVEDDPVDDHTRSGAFDAPDPAGTPDLPDAPTSNPRVV